ncbi:MAG TPA: polysaccharide deacetylase family protein [Gemmatimonadaceae bacterium]|nr:polysaccharide deacetylase family protein [Gemmatimonadaceae bacterium]
MRLVRDTAYRLTLATRYPAYRRRRAGAAIFAFHNVAPDDGVSERSDRSLHITSSDFQDYLAVIADGHSVVPLAEIADRVRQRRSVDGLAALTFDDAYHGALTHGVRAMARRGVPSSVFVVSDAAAAPSPFWWDLLGTDGAVQAPVRERALHVLRGDRDAVLAHYPVKDHEVPAALMPASWREVRAAVRAGCTVGSHTVSHRNLAALDAAALREELERSRAEIGAALGTAPTEISYPYGLHNDAVIEAARYAGYQTGVTMRFALATGDDDPLALPRISVPAGISIPALECWAAGIRLRGAS